MGARTGFHGWFEAINFLICKSATYKSAKIVFFALNEASKSS